MSTCGCIDRPKNKKEALIVAIVSCGYQLTCFTHQIGDTFKMLEDNTGVQRLYIAYGLGGIIVLWLAFGFGAQVGLHQTFFA